MGCGISHRKNENRENLIHTNCGIIRVFKGTLVGLDVRATEFSLKRARQACKSIRFATVRGFGAGFRSNFKRGSKKISELRKHTLFREVIRSDGQ